MAQEDYRKALRLGQKEFRSGINERDLPYLQALDEDPGAHRGGIHRTARRCKYPFGIHRRYENGRAQNGICRYFMPL